MADQQSTDSKLGSAREYTYLYNYVKAVRELVAKNGEFYNSIKTQNPNIDNELNTRNMSDIIKVIKKYSNHCGLAGVKESKLIELANYAYRMKSPVPELDDVDNAKAEYDKAMMERDVQSANKLDESKEKFKTAKKDKNKKNLKLFGALMLGVLGAVATGGLLGAFGTAVAGVISTAMGASFGITSGFAVAGLAVSVVAGRYLFKGISAMWSKISGAVKKAAAERKAAKQTFKGAKADYKKCKSDRALAERAMSMDRVYEQGSSYPGQNLFNSNAYTQTRDFNNVLGHVITDEESMNLGATPTAGQPNGPVADQPTGPVADQPTGPVADQPTGPVAGQPAGPVAGQPTGPVNVNPQPQGYESFNDIELLDERMRLEEEYERSEEQRMALLGGDLSNVPVDSNDPRYAPYTAVSSRQAEIGGRLEEVNNQLKNRPITQAVIDHMKYNEGFIRAEESAGFDSEQYKEMKRAIPSASDEDFAQMISNTNNAIATLEAELNTGSPAGATPLSIIDYEAKLSELNATRRIAREVQEARMERASEAGTGTGNGGSNNNLESNEEEEGLNEEELAILNSVYGYHELSTEGLIDERERVTALELARQESVKANYEGKSFFGKVKEFGVSSNKKRKSLKARTDNKDRLAEIAEQLSNASKHPTTSAVKAKLQSLGHTKATDPSIGGYILGNGEKILTAGDKELRKAKTSEAIDEKVADYQRRIDELDSQIDGEQSESLSVVAYENLLSERNAYAVLVARAPEIKTNLEEKIAREQEAEEAKQKAKEDARIAKEEEARKRQEEKERKLREAEQAETDAIKQVYSLENLHDLSADALYEKREEYRKLLQDTTISITDPEQIEKMHRGIETITAELATRPFIDLSPKYRAMVRDDDSITMDEGFIRIEDAATGTVLVDENGLVTIVPDEDRVSELDAEVLGYESLSDEELEDTLRTLEFENSNYSIQLENLTKKPSTKGLTEEEQQLAMSLANSHLVSFGAVEVLSAKVNDNNVRIDAVKGVAEKRGVKLVTPSMIKKDTSVHKGKNAGYFKEIEKIIPDLFKQYEKLNKDEKQTAIRKSIIDRLQEIYPSNKGLEKYVDEWLKIKYPISISKKSGESERSGGKEGLTRYEVLEILSGNGMKLADFPEYANDYTAVMLACRQNGLALQYASPEKQAHREIVDYAMKENPASYQYSSMMLRDNARDSMWLLERNPDQAAEMLYLASLRGQSCKELVVKYVEMEGEALSCAAPALKNDIDVVMAAVSQDPGAIVYASKDKQRDPEVIEVARNAAENEIDSNQKIIKSLIVEGVASGELNTSDTFENVEETKKVVGGFLLGKLAAVVKEKQEEAKEAEANKATVEDAEKAWGNLNNGIEYVLNSYKFKKGSKISAEVRQEMIDMLSWSLEDTELNAFANAEKVDAVKLVDEYLSKQGVTVEEKKAEDPEIVDKKEENKEADKADTPDAKTEEDELLDLEVKLEEMRDLKRRITTSLNDGELVSAQREYEKSSRKIAGWVAESKKIQSEHEGEIKDIGQGFYTLEHNAQLLSEYAGKIPTTKQKDTHYARRRELESIGQQWGFSEKIEDLTEGMLRAKASQLDLDMAALEREIKAKKQPQANLENETAEDINKQESGESANEGNDGVQGGDSHDEEDTKIDKKVDDKKEEPSNADTLEQTDAEAEQEVLEDADVIKSKGSNSETVTESAEEKEEEKTGVAQKLEVDNKAKERVIVNETQEAVDEAIEKAEIEAQLEELRAMKANIQHSLDRGELVSAQKEYKKIGSKIEMWVQNSQTIKDQLGDKIRDTDAYYVIENSSELLKQYAGLIPTRKEQSTLNEDKRALEYIGKKWGFDEKIDALNEDRLIEKSSQLDLDIANLERKLKRFSGESSKEDEKKEVEADVSKPSTEETKDKGEPAKVEKDPALEAAKNRLKELFKAGENLQDSAILSSLINEFNLDEIHIRALIEYTEGLKSGMIPLEDEEVAKNEAVTENAVTGEVKQASESDVKPERGVDYDKVFVEAKMAIAEAMDQKVSATQLQKKYEEYSMQLAGDRQKLQAFARFYENNKPKESEPGQE